MALDKWIAVFFLVLSLIYGYAAYTYPLLPFELHMSFLPNTMPLVLSVLGVILAMVILFSKKPVDAGGDVLGDMTLARWREYKLGQAFALIVAMVLYALLLRPIGFIAATTLFLVGTSWALGERKWPLMIGVALFGAVGIWLLVQEALGIFLRPLPGFMS